MTSAGTALQSFAGSESGTTVTLNAGVFIVAELGVAGYTATADGCSGTLVLGQAQICTITNDDQPAHLTVIKTVINDNGGNKGAADFSITVTGGAPVPATFPGSASGTDVTLSAGAYSVDEAAVAGYSETGAVGCTGTLALGETRVCTITNDDQAVAVTVATTLSGGGQTGPSIRVAPGVSATDQATLYGVTPSAGGTITYKVYSDSSCATLVFDATPPSNTVVNGTAPASTAFSSSSVGIFYWQAVYSGDLNDPRASSVCSDERLRVAPSDAPVLLVKKHVINDSGGRDATKVASNFMYQPQNANGGGLTQSFPGSETGRLFEFAPGTFYNVVEITDPAPTYAVSYSAECTATLQAGDVKTCTITNDDIPPARLTVIKHVINDSGGGDATKVAANFSLQILNANGSGITQSFAGSETGTLLELPRGGAYRVAELTDPAPTYALSFSGDCTGTIQAGDTKTCTVINDDIPPARLTVIKHVVNDNGGTAVAANFSLQIQNANGGGITGSFPGSESGTLIEIPRGAPYSVVEVINRAPAYASTVSADCSGTIAAGDSKTCTVTNDDQPAHLRVIKTVINNNGGTKAPGDFTITVTSAGAALPSFPGSAAGTDVILSAGAYSVDEAAVAGYTKTGAVGCTGTLALSETKTCTITNDDNAVPTATLTVIKHVVNDNGGAALAGAWSMTVTNNGTLLPSFAGSETGTAVVLSPGSYSTAESGGPAGYTASLTAGCSGTIAAGDTKTCTITNDDQSAHLTVIKHVVNDNGGTKGAGDFTIIVTGGAPSPGSFAGAESPGTLVTLNAGGFSVDEVTLLGYTRALSAGCSGTIAPGETLACTVTNDDIAAVQHTLTVTKAGSGGGIVTSSSGGIFCGDVCAADYADGTVVMLFASADSASAFVGWSGACTGTGDCSVTMDGAKTVGATFDTRIAQVILGANPANIGADGASTSSITARAVDALGAPVIAASAIVISLTSSNAICCVLTTSRSGVCARPVTSIDGRPFESHAVSGVPPS